MPVGINFSISVWLSPQKNLSLWIGFLSFYNHNCFLVIASMMMSKDTQSSPIQGGSKRSLTTYLFKKFAESWRIREANCNLTVENRSSHFCRNSRHMRLKWRVFLKASSVTFGLIYKKKSIKLKIKQTFLAILGLFLHTVVEKRAQKCGSINLL